MEFMLGLLLGMASGWFLFRTLLMMKVEKFYDDLEKHQDQKKTVDYRISVKFEKYNDQWYAYNKENDMYLTQGKTYEDIVNNLDKIYPDITFMVSPAALKKIKNI